GGDIHQPQIALIGGDLLQHQQLLVVGLPIEHTPTAALQLQQHAVGFGIGGVHDPDIGVLASAASGAVGEAIVVIGEAGARVARFAVVQQGDAAGGGVVGEDLNPPPPADIFAEDEIAAAGSV